MAEYIEFLKRYSRDRKIGLWMANQHAICRVVAKEYGVTEEDLLWLDENL